MTEHDTRLWVRMGLASAVCVLLLTQAGCSDKVEAEPQSQPVAVGERPGVAQHVDQADLVSKKTSFDEMFNLGQQLFVAKFNKLDGLGRPAATGNGAPTKRQAG